LSAPGLATPPRESLSEFASRLFQERCAERSMHDASEQETSASLIIGQ
jgi:hypothetical protein